MAHPDDDIPDAIAPPGYLGLDVFRRINYRNGPITDDDPQVDRSSAAISSEVGRMMKKVLSEEGLPEPQQHAITSKLEKDINISVQHHLIKYDESLQNKNKILEWESQQIRENVIASTSSSEDWLVYNKPELLESILEVPVTLIGQRSLFLEAFRDDIQQNIGSLQGFLKSNVWQIAQKELKEKRALLIKAEDEIEQLHEKLKAFEESKDQSYKQLLLHQNAQIEELETIRDTLEASLASEKKYEVADLMFSEISWKDAEEWQIPVWRRIDIAFLAIVNMRDDVDRCEEAIRQTTLPFRPFGRIIERFEHARKDVADHLEKARKEPRLEISNHLYDGVKLCRARVLALRVMMVENDIDPPPEHQGKVHRVEITAIPPRWTTPSKPSPEKIVKSSRARTSHLYNKHNPPRTPERQGSMSSSTQTISDMDSLQSRETRTFNDLEQTLKDFITTREADRAQKEAATAERYNEMLSKLEDSVESLNGVKSNDKGIEKEEHYKKLFEELQTKFQHLNKVLNTLKDQKAPSDNSSEHFDKLSQTLHAEFQKLTETVRTLKDHIATTNNIDDDNNDASQVIQSGKLSEDIRNQLHELEDRLQLALTERVQSGRQSEQSIEQNLTAHLQEHLREAGQHQADGQRQAELLEMLHADIATLAKEQTRLAAGNAQAQNLENLLERIESILKRNLQEQHHQQQQAQGPCADNSETGGHAIDGRSSHFTIGHRRIPLWYLFAAALLFLVIWVRLGQYELNRSYMYANTYKRAQFFNRRPMNWDWMIPAFLLEIFNRI